MKRFHILALISLAVAVGCSRRPAETPAPPSAPAKSTSIEDTLKKDSEAPAAPAAPSTVPVNAAPEAAGVQPGGTTTQSYEEVAASSEVGNLSRALRLYVENKHRFPSDLNELARTANMRIPPIPAGTKLVIDKTDTTVKLVKAKAGS